MAVLLPGFANVHSHAFQRLLRGSVQRRDPARDDSFWTWRERMYALAERLTLDEIERAARLCYVECCEAGYTSVGEFHYLHHDVGGAPFAPAWATALAHVRAAQQTGIRLTLLWCVYARGDVDDSPLSERQRRFAAADVDAVWRAIDGLVRAIGDTPRVRVGIALHSVRAVPRAWLGALAAGARERGMPIHAHVSEQPREVARCREVHGVSPVGLLAGEGVLGPDFTAVHATWLDDDDVATLAGSGSSVCLCPTTEGDLGDGVPRTADLFAAGVPLCIGSDSHAVIDPFAELRLAEYQARAATLRRCVLSDARGEVAPALEAIGAGNGHRALGQPGGDRVWLRADDRVFEATGDARAVALVGGHRGLVDRVEIGGDAIVAGGRHLGAAG